MYDYYSELHMRRTATTHLQVTRSGQRVDHLLAMYSSIKINPNMQFIVEHYKASKCDKTLLITNISVQLIVCLT